MRELARRRALGDNIRQAKAKASESEPGESEVSQLRRIQRRNQELEQENAFLKKAAAWFAADSGQRGGTGRTNGSAVRAGRNRSELCGSRRVQGAGY